MTREEVLIAAFVATIKEIGIENFKKCSFFMRNNK
jgi:hypothetical protein